MFTVSSIYMNDIPHTSRSPYGFLFRNSYTAVEITPGLVPDITTLISLCNMNKFN